MERVILNELGFDVGTPTSQWFGGRFARHQKASRKTINAMNMLLDLVLLHIQYIAYRPSYIAAACLCYANVLTGSFLAVPSFLHTQFRAVHQTLGYMTGKLGRVVAQTIEAPTLTRLPTGRRN